VQDQNLNGTIHTDDEGEGVVVAESTAEEEEAEEGDNTDRVIGKNEGQEDPEEDPETKPEDAAAEQKADTVEAPQGKVRKVGKVRKACKSTKTANVPASGSQQTSIQTQPTGGTATQSQAKLQKPAGSMPAKKAKLSSVNDETEKTIENGMPVSTKVIENAEVEVKVDKVVEKIVEQVDTTPGSSDATVAELSMLRSRLQNLQAELKAKDAIIARMQKVCAAAHEQSLLAV
jgi:hypothetical protein